MFLSTSVPALARMESGVGVDSEEKGYEKWKAEGLEIFLGE